MEPRVTTHRTRTLGSRRWGTIALFLGPAVVLYGVFVLLPIAQAMYYSLFKWNGLQPLTNFVGLDNFGRALNADPFLHAAGNNAFILVLTLFIQIPIALGLAVYLNGNFPGRAAFRLIYFLPYVISEVVIGILYYQLLQPSGSLNSVLEAV